MELKYSILVVEDEKNISDFICERLRKNGFNVDSVTSGREALLSIHSRCPDLIILDLGLPDMDGNSIIRSVRKWTKVPIIVVSARDDESDKVLALDFGADDYLTKPFGTEELLARIRAALRHWNLNDIGKGHLSFYAAKGLTIDFEKRRIQLHGEDVHFTQNEYRIVSFLAKSSGKVLTYNSVMKAVWGPHILDDNKILRVNMANIRRKIEINPAEPKYIFTEVGVGYRMVENEVKDCI